ncbi:unnamed protein product [Adineta steineri]|uniref:EGF-like domain-containing protein n=1 Tax=Adineta steineri TaxID=433720 RepID=A0A818ZYP9_9BILA|nr:unnamed protein product [Adineta steineri]
MSIDLTNLGSLTPIHTDFGNTKDDLLVVEYDVPQTKVKQTLFYKYGQLSIPKWALIPAGILAFGLITALFAIMINSILAQSSITVTYSQYCSKTSVCKEGVGLTCGSLSKCVCSSTQQYWYENLCVDQPTYTEQCNQTTECRTDLGLICAEIDGQCNCPNTTKVQTCDCSSTSYWTGSKCTNRLSYLGACTVADTSYQCLSTLYCNGSMCICSPYTQYWNDTADECYSIDKYHALCNTSTSYSCDASVSLQCLFAGDGSQCPFNATANTTSCECANGTYWNGGSCVTKKSINIACYWSCECNTDAGLQCLNLTCVCPSKQYWSTQTSSCEAQKNYTETSCSNTTQCDSTQGLTCYLSGSACNCPITSSVNMCDCLSTQYYDYNLTSCQTLQLYNDTCYGNYMCDSTVGLFCQLNTNSAANCSCPEPIRLYMCDCNITSYWNGLACVSRLAPNVSCTYEYECEANFTCYVNETDNGIFSDVCRCPIGYYYVSGSGCVPSVNYSLSCEGSYQCYELAPLSCRYNYTGLTCLDIGDLPACDCQDNYYYNTNSGLCLPKLSRLGNCTQSCQCSSPYICTQNFQCDCIDYYSTLNSSCVQYLQYGDACTSASQCAATPSASMSCVSGTCGCNSTGYWSGSQCLFTTNFRSTCNNDKNCFNGLTCYKISSIDSNKRCSCPSGQYYSTTSSSCATCTAALPLAGYTNIVVNFVSSDACVAIKAPAYSFSSTLSYSTANTFCTGLTPMISGHTPQLISLHNLTDLSCLATALNTVSSGSKCSSQLYFLGFNSTSLTFYDGTQYYPTFIGTPIGSSKCLTICLSGSSTGTLAASECSNAGGWDFTAFGAVCDYFVN